MWCRLLTWCDRGSSEAKQSLCNAELELTTSCLMVNPKSYGAWQQVTVAHLKAAHTLMSRPQQRIWVMGNAPTAPWAAELALCTKFLSADTRNCAYAVSPCHELTCAQFIAGTIVALLPLTVPPMSRNLIILRCKTTTPQGFRT